MDKVKVCVSGIFYPVTIMMYFVEALRQREDVELVEVGPYTDTWIPWSGGMDLPTKYAKCPTVPIHKSQFQREFMDAGFLHDHEALQDIDVWMQVDSTFAFNTRPPCKTLVHIATDPHVIQNRHYDVGRNLSDYFFNMQDCYKEPSDIYLPYAASKYHHYPMDVEKEYDVCLVGLQYPQRTQLVNALRGAGVSVHYEIGLGPDEYREAYAKSRVAISWSSLDDLIARVFEAGAMKLPLVCNAVPDLGQHFSPGQDLMMFGNSIPEAVGMVKMLLNNPDGADHIAESMYSKVMGQHTYDHRIEQIFDVIGV